MQAWKLHAREPGDPIDVRRPTGGGPAGKRYEREARHARGWGVGRPRSVRWAATWSGGLKSRWCSDGEHHIQTRGSCLAGFDVNRGGQGVHREMESEGLAEKLRAGIDGSHPDDEPVGQRGGKVESALWRRRRFHPPLEPRCVRPARSGRPCGDPRRSHRMPGERRSVGRDAPISRHGEGAVGVR